jgi:serine phosphatase RsbU (regulator of sigma subunit)
MISLQQIQMQLSAVSSPQEQLQILIKDFPKMLRFGAGNLEEAKTLLPVFGALANEVGDQNSLGQYYKSEALTAFYEVRYTDALRWSQKAIRIFEDTGNNFSLAEMISGLAMAVWDMGNFSDALEHAFRVMRIYQEMGNNAMGGITSYQIGSFYYDLKDYANAEYYFQQGYTLSLTSESTRTSAARSLVGLGDVSVAKGDYQKAFAFFMQAKQIQEEVNDVAGLARTLNDLGTTHRSLGEFELALQYLKQSEAIRRTLSNKTGLITTLIELGELFLLQKEYKQALQLLDEAVELTRGQQTKAKRFRAFRLLSDVHKNLGNFESALQYYHDFYQLKEEVMGDEFGLKMKNLEKKAELERSEREAEIYRLRNVELKSAYDEVEKKNRDITSSINYAKRIQDAMLPHWELAKQHLAEAFVYFVPRDIVSGDFYWFAEKDGKAIVAAVDCTGHGVPGAFMSMIGMNLLAQIVHLKGITAPAAILDQMHLGIQQALQQSQGENRDGMDMAVCTLDYQQQRLAFAGAKNPLVYVENGALQVIKGDKMPIGGAEAREGQRFTEHSIPMLPGNAYYLFSDGFEDQFGGPQNKKFKQQRLRELLLSICHLPMQAQRQALQQAFEHWKGQERQIDDVLVLGFKPIALPA